MKDTFWGSKEKKEESEFMNAQSGGSEAANGGNSNNIVEISNNKIFYYSTVDRGRVLKLNKAILNLSSSIVFCIDLTGHFNFP